MNCCHDILGAIPGNCGTEVDFKLDKKVVHGMQSIVSQVSNFFGMDPLRGTKLKYLQRKVELRNMSKCNFKEVS